MKKIIESAASMKRPSTRMLLFMALLFGFQSSLLYAQGIKIGSGAYFINSGAIVNAKNAGITNLGSLSNVTSGSVKLSGDWQNSGSYTTDAGSTVYLNGATLQSVGGTNPTTFSNLQLNNAAGGTLSNSITISGTLDLQAGILTTGSNSVTLGSSGSISNAGSSKYINGKLIQTFVDLGSKTFPIGKGGNYRPLSFQYSQLTGTSLVAAEQFETAIGGALPSNTTLLTTDRHWTLSQTGGSSLQFFVTLDPTGYTPSRPVVMLNQESGSLVSHPATTPNYTNLSALTVFSDLALGENCINPTDGGTIAGDQANCGSYTPATITSSLPPSGSTGTLEYKWQSSTSGDNTGFADIAGSNSASYSPPGSISQTTWYKRLARVDCKTDWTGAAESNVVVKTVYSQPTAGISGSTTVCLGDNAPAITFTGSNGLAPYTFAYTLNSSGTLTVTTSSGNSVNVSQSTAVANQFFYSLQSVTDSHGCAQAQTGIVVITVSPTGQVNQPGNQLVCNSAPTAEVDFTTSNSTGTTTYAWVNDTPAAGLAAGGSGSVPSFTAINPGSSQITVTITVTPTYTLPIATQPQSSIHTGAGGISGGDGVSSTTDGYNNGTTSSGSTAGNGNISIQNGGPTFSCQGPSKSFTITVNPSLPVSVAIAADANPVCSGTPVNFTATAVNGGSSPSYQWKVNGNNSGTNSQTLSYTPLNNDLVSCVLTSSAACASGNPATSDPLKMNVDPVTVAGSVSGGTLICAGNTSGLLSLGAHTGVITGWQSSVNPFTSWASISNTAATYTSGPLSETTLFRAVVQSGVCPQQASAPATVTVDVTPPAVTANNSSVTLNPSGSYSLQTSDVLSSYSDPGSGIASISITPSSVSCPSIGQTIPVAVVVTDNCGNHTNVTSLITVLEGTALPAPWFSCVVGNSAGTAFYTPCTGNGRFTLNAMGYSSTNADVLESVYQTISGNGSIVARVYDLTGGGWAGVQIRESCDPGSKKVLLKTQIQMMIRADVRQTQGGATLSTQIMRQGIKWLKLVRTGNRFDAYSSGDGVLWLSAFSTTLAMNPSVQLGIFSEGLSYTRSYQARFDNVVVTGSGSPSGPNGTSKNTETGNVAITTNPDIQLEIYPNPASKMVNIVLSGTAEKASLTILTTDGKSVQSVQIDRNSSQIDISRLMPGIYILRFVIDNEIVTRRLVVI